MSSNVKSTPITRYADSRGATTFILWTMAVVLAVVAYLAACIGAAHIRATNGMAETVEGPFGSLTKLDGGLPDWDFLVTMADRGDFLLAWGLWIASGVAVIAACIIFRRSSFFQGFKNS